MSNDNGNKDYIPNDVADQILEELWKHTFSEGCKSMKEAHDDWWGKPPSVWPSDVKQNILLKGVLDLIADTRRSISEIQDVIQRVDREIGAIKKTLNRDDVLKQLLEVDERRSDDKTES